MRRSGISAAIFGKNRTDFRLIVFPALINDPLTMPVPTMGNIFSPLDSHPFLIFSTVD